MCLHNSSSADCAPSLNHMAPPAKVLPLILSKLSDHTLLSTNRKRGLTECVCASVLIRACFSLLKRTHSIDSLSSSLRSTLHLSPNARVRLP